MHEQKMVRWEATVTVELPEGVEPPHIKQLKVNGKDVGLHSSTNIGAFALIHSGQPKPPGTHACHINGDPTDNRLENLKWDTASANCRAKRTKRDPGIHWKESRQKYGVQVPVYGPEETLRDCAEAWGSKATPRRQNPGDPEPRIELSNGYWRTEEEANAAAEEVRTWLGENFPELHWAVPQNWQDTRWRRVDADSSSRHRSQRPDAGGGHYIPSDDSGGD